MLFACATALLAQSEDVHPSGPNTIREMRVRFWRGRYELRNATLVDLIHTAWNVDPDNVVGGPDWLDLKRFDVIATAPADSTPETLHLILRELLKARFQLAVHNAETKRPAYFIEAEKKPELQPADGAEDSACVPRPDETPARRPGLPVEPVIIDCRNVTVAALAKSMTSIREMSGYLFNYPVLDRTGLKGAWNFSLKWTPRNFYFPAPAAGEPITLFDAFRKQLGLKLSLGEVAAPVIVVDKVNEKPTPNRPGVSEQLSSRPQFEVADIKQDREVTEGSYVRIDRGGLVRIHMSMKGLILEAGGDYNPHRIIGGPKDMDSTRWFVLARAPAEEGAASGWNGPVWNGVDVDSMRAMLRSLLEDRFKLETHIEEREVSGYALVAAKPKLRKANGTNRPGCKEGPGADGKDPRLTNPMASRLFTCRNVTLVQFVDHLNEVMYGGLPTMDATGISGRYDMTLDFSPPSAFTDTPGPDSDSRLAASEPNGAISIFEALEKQLGLKLKTRKVMVPVIVIDHVNETPTEN
jgi:uncharacterized protein (TIGR03435 family)